MSIQGEQRYVIKTDTQDRLFEDGTVRRSVKQIMVYDTLIKSIVPYGTYCDECDNPFEMCDRLNRDHRALMFEEEVYLDEVCGYAEMNAE